MAVIKTLPPHVADMIAAGEVVERPGSVIKELVENAVDAGADAVTVEIKNGGMTYMRVTDNGCGMSSDDAVTAFLRHATSKLRDERGLEAIGTLGFRGEALAAISAVSKIELLTREKGAEEGTCVCVEGGVVTQNRPTGCPEGTTMIVRDLFYNTPARQKFMKTDRAESSNIANVVLKCALSHPEVSVRYIRDGKEECHTPGDGRVDSAVYTLLGRELANGMIVLPPLEGKIKVSGYISAPVSARGNRSYQFFFVNGRNIKSKTLQAALEQAYKNSLFTGRYPGCVIYVEMSTAAVDVNVHPAKTEVRFANEKEVFDAVYYACRAALDGEGKKAELSISKSTSAVFRTAPAPEKQAEAVTRPRNDFFRTVTADAYKKEYSAPKPAPVPHVSSDPVRKASPVTKPIVMHDSVNAIYGKSPTVQQMMEMPAEKVVAAPTVSEKPRQVIPENTGKAKNYRIIGEALDTYILVEMNDSLFLIDKHAAHERMIFDRLKASDMQIMSQQLISPVVCDMDEQMMRAIMSDIPLLESFGFEVDEFGEKSIAIRALPADIDEKDVLPMIDEIAERLLNGHRADPSEMRDDILHTVACKAAIKAGKRSQPEELIKVADAVLADEVRYCPHGRPVVMELTRAAIDKNFKRT